MSRRSEERENNSVKSEKLCKANKKYYKENQKMLKVTGLCKEYPSFSLKNVSFEVPDGCITGFIGRNGAGKTTTLKSVMRTVIPSGGKVEINGLDMRENETELKKRISFTTGTFNYYKFKKLKTIASSYAGFYDDFDFNVFNSYAEKFELNLNKRVNELSAGMSVKFSLALALSHGAEIFIFDEPTSGLDPVAREEILDLFTEIVSDGKKSILFSTHITEDLEKCADYVLYIRKGEIIFDKQKDELLDGHALIKGGLDDLNEQLEQAAISIKTNSFGFSGLIERSALELLCEENLLSANIVTEKPTLDDVTVFYERAGGNKQ